VGGLLLPLLTGWLLDRNGGQALPWATLVCLVATTAVALAVVVVVGRLAHDH
jgi:fucose permease